MKTWKDEIAEEMEYNGESMDDVVHIDGPDWDWMGAIPEHGSVCFRIYTGQHIYFQHIEEGLAPGEYSWRCDSVPRNPPQKGE